STGSSNRGSRVGLPRGCRPSKSFRGSSPIPRACAMAKKRAATSVTLRRSPSSFRAVTTAVWLSCAIYRQVAPWWRSFPRPKLASLGLGNGINRGATVRVRAQAYLDKDQGSSLFTDEVDLAAPGLVIALDQRVAEGRKMSCRELLGGIPDGAHERVSGGSLRG